MPKAQVGSDATKAAYGILLEKEKRRTVQNRRGKEVDGKGEHQDRHVPSRKTGARKGQGGRRREEEKEAKKKEDGRADPVERGEEKAEYVPVPEDMDEEDVTLGEFQNKREWISEEYDGGIYEGL